MTYTWYKIFNKTEFLALDLVSKEYTLSLEGVGQKSILVTLGNELSVVYDGVTLVVEFNGANPFEFDGHAVYIDTNDDVHLGIAAE